MDHRPSIVDLPRDQQTGQSVPLDSSKQVRKFREYLKATKKKTTAMNYPGYARRFEEFLESRGHTMANAPRGSFADFVVWLIDDQKLKATTVHMAVSAVRSYLQWLGGRMPIPHYAEPDLPRIYQKKKYTPEKEDVDRFEKAARATVGKEPARTILLLLPHCGLRISEICGLTLKGSISKRKIGDINWTTFTAPVKGGDEKELPLMPPGDPIFSAYLFGWRAQLKKKSKWLFPGNGTAHITPDCIRGYLNEVRGLIDLPMLTPHAFRRFFATYQHVVKGNDISTVSKMLGHKTTKTTELYYINPSTMQVLKKIKT